MAIDLTGGMDPSKDHFLAERPDDPEFRESAVVLGLRRPRARSDCPASASRPSPRPGTSATSS